VALGDRLPAELLDGFASRRRQALQVRDRALRRLSVVLPRGLFLAVRGCVEDIDELSVLDNLDDTVRSLTFDGRGDYLARKRLVQELARAGAVAADSHPFDLDQDHLVELGEQWRAKTASSTLG
jgi:hypothetical protein